MFYDFETSPSLAVPNNVENFEGYSVPSQLVPLKIEIVNDFLGELNWIATFPKNSLSYTDYKSKIMTKKKKIAIDWKYVDMVYEFVQQKKEIGVCSQELLVIYFFIGVILCCLSLFFIFQRLTFFAFKN